MCWCSLAACIQKKGHFLLPSFFSFNLYFPLSHTSLTRITSILPSCSSQSFSPPLSFSPSSFSPPSSRSYYIILPPSSAHTCLTSPLFSSLLSFPVYHLPHLLTSLLLIPSSLPISCPVLYPAVDGHVFSFSCSSVSSYGTLQKCDGVTTLLPPPPHPPPPPAVLFNPVKDIFFSVSPSCLFPPSICSSPPWHSAEVSPLCSSSCLHMVTLSPPLLLLFPSSSSAYSDGARSNMTGCKNPPLSSFHPFSPPMESLPHSSIPLPSSPCLPVVFHHFRGPWDSKHDKVWKPACMLHTPPLVSTYGPVFHPDRFTDTERKLNISLKDYSQTMFENERHQRKSHIAHVQTCRTFSSLFQGLSWKAFVGLFARKEPQIVE